MLNTDRFEEFISQYPIYEQLPWWILAEIEVRERCGSSVNRSVSVTALPACPLLWAALEECGKNPQLSKWNPFSSVAEVSDVMNMAEMFATRDAHEEPDYRGSFILKGEGFETFYLVH